MDDVASAFVERLGCSLEFFGLSRNAGRILAYLVYFRGPASFEELETELAISRGSISGNTRHLEQIAVLERVSRPGERVDYFQLTRDSQARFLEMWFSHVRDLDTILQDTLDQLPADSEAFARISEADRFYRYVSDRMTSCLESWEEAQADRKPPT